MKFYLFDSDRSIYYELFKILRYKDGGFALILPSFKSSEKGRLEKIKVEYQEYGTKMILRKDRRFQYAADDIVKLSYHGDGFVQFSSAKSEIISGKDDKGRPKGLGVQSWPFSAPVSTGASVTLSLWGIEHLRVKDRLIVNRELVFETDGAHRDVGYEQHDSKPSLFAFSFYVVPKKNRGDVVEVNGVKYAHLTYMQKFDNSMNFFRRLRESVRVYDLESENSLCISFSMIKNGMNQPYGFKMGGPTDGKYGLVATYPDDGSVDKRFIKPIGYKRLQS